MSRCFLTLTLILLVLLLLSAVPFCLAQKGFAATTTAGPKLGDNASSPPQASPTPAPVPAEPVRPVIGGTAPFKNERTSLRFHTDEAFFLETAAAVAIATSLSFPTNTNTTQLIKLKDTLLLGTFSLKSQSVEFKTVEALSQRLTEANMHVTWVLHLVSRSVWGTYVVTHFNSLAFTNVDNPDGPQGAKSFSLVQLKGGSDVFGGSTTTSSDATGSFGGTGTGTGGGTTSSGGSRNGSSAAETLSDEQIEARIFPPRNYRTLCTNLPSLRSQVVATLPGDVTNNDFTDRGRLGRKISWPLADVRGEEYALVLTRCIWSNTIADSYADLIASDAPITQIEEWTRNVFTTNLVKIAAAVSLDFNISLPPNAIMGMSSQLASIRLRAMFIIEIAGGIAYITLGIGLVFWMRLSSIKMLLMRCFGAGLVISCVGLEREEVARAIEEGLLVRNVDGSVSSAPRNFLAGSTLAAAASSSSAHADVFGNEPTDDATSSEEGTEEDDDEESLNDSLDHDDEDDEDSLASQRQDEASPSSRRNRRRSSSERRRQQQKEKTSKRSESDRQKRRRGAEDEEGADREAAAEDRNRQQRRQEDQKRSASGTSSGGRRNNNNNNARSSNTSGRNTNSSNNNNRRHQQQRSNSNASSRHRRRRKKRSSSRVSSPRLLTTNTRQPKFLFAIYYILIARAFVSIFSTFGLWSAWNGERLVVLEFIAESLNTVVTCVEMAVLLWLATGLGTTRHHLSVREVQICFCILLAFVVCGSLNAACATERTPFDVVDSLFATPNFGVNCDTVFLAYALLQNVTGLICYVLIGNQVQIMFKALRDPMARSAWKVRGGDTRTKSGFFVEQDGVGGGGNAAAAAAAAVAVAANANGASLMMTATTTMTSADFHQNGRSSSRYLARRGVIAPSAIVAGDGTNSNSNDADEEMRALSPEEMAAAAAALNTPSGSDLSGRRPVPPFASSHALMLYQQQQEQRRNNRSRSGGGGDNCSDDGDHVVYVRDENGDLLAVPRRANSSGNNNNNNNSANNNKNSNTTSNVFPPPPLAAAAVAAAATTASSPGNSSGGVVTASHRRRISNESGSAKSGGSGAPAAAAAASSHRRRGSKDSVNSYSFSSNSDNSVGRQAAAAAGKPAHQQSTRREQILHRQAGSRTPELTSLALRNRGVNDDDDDDDDDGNYNNDDDDCYSDHQRHRPVSSRHKDVAIGRVNSMQHRHANIDGAAARGRDRGRGGAIRSASSAAHYNDHQQEKEKILPPLCTVDMWLRLRDFRWPFLIVALLPVLRAVGESAWKDIGGVVLLLVVERLSVFFLELLVIYYFGDCGKT